MGRAIYARQTIPPVEILADDGGMCAAIAYVITVAKRDTQAMQRRAWMTVDCSVPTWKTVDIGARRARGRPRTFHARCRARFNMRAQHEMHTTRAFGTLGS
jgi:hypothetical protein